jgi:sugar O-acyltransferase (sialic acid O-acetyltransferase NeuD family)
LAAIFETNLQNQIIMKKVIVLGAGGHAAEIDEYIRHTQRVTLKRDLKIVGFLDDNANNYSKYAFSAPLLGGIQNHQISRDINYIIGIAGLEHRFKIVERFKAEGAVFLTFVHCSAYISDSAKIGEGSIIGPNVNLGPNVRIGEFTLINARCSIAHDTIIGDFNFISPNVCLSGATEVGHGNLFGINSATIPSIKVGNNNKIAAGMVLDQNIGDDSVVFYRFKERVIAIPK